LADAMRSRSRADHASCATTRPIPSDRTTPHAAAPALRARAIASVRLTPAAKKKERRSTLAYLSSAAQQVIIAAVPKAGYSEYLEKRSRAVSKSAALVRRVIRGREHEIHDQGDDHARDGVRTGKQGFRSWPDAEPGADRENDEVQRGAREGGRDAGG